MRRPPKTTLSQTEVRAQMGFFAQAAGVETPEALDPREARGGGIGKARGKVPETLSLRAPEPSEGEVQQAAHTWLEHDRRVAWVVRCNNGAAVDHRGQIFRMVRTLKGGAVHGWPDLLGQMADGRLLAVECKATRRDWRKPTWFEANADALEMDLGVAAARLMAQWRFLRTVAQAGGAAGVVWGPTHLDACEAIVSGEHPGLFL